MTIPDSVIFTADIAAACRGRDMLVFAVPSPYVRATARAAAATSGTESTPLGAWC